MAKVYVLSLGTRDNIEFAPILGILVGVVTALLLVTVVVLGAVRIRSARREGSRALRPAFFNAKEKVTLPLRSESEDLFEKDDKNPDVIPNNKDSDYQLGSALQTPGLNNSETAPTEYETTAGNGATGAVVGTVNATAASQQQPLGPLQEAYLARDRNYPPQLIDPELTYAELNHVRPNSLEPIKNGGNQYGTLPNRNDTTIYAQIDHSRRPPPSKTPVIVSPVSAIFPHKQGIYHREVVTVRTPLMGCQQESCV